jgi:hypothetical protein
MMYTKMYVIPRLELLERQTLTSYVNIKAGRHHGGLRLDAGSGKTLVAGPLLPPEPGPTNSILHLCISDTYCGLLPGYHSCCCRSLQSANAYGPEVSYRSQLVHGVYQHHHRLFDTVSTDTDATRFAAANKAEDIARFRLCAWLRVSTVEDGLHALFADSLTVSSSSRQFASYTSTA